MYPVRVAAGHLIDPMSLRYSVPRLSHDHELFSCPACDNSRATFSSIYLKTFEYDHHLLNHLLAQTKHTHKERSPKDVHSLETRPLLDLQPHLPPRPVLLLLTTWRTLSECNHSRNDTFRPQRTNMARPEMFPLQHEKE